MTASCGSITIEATLHSETAALQVVLALESTSLVIAVDGIEYTAVLLANATIAPTAATLDFTNSTSTTSNRKRTAVIVGVVFAVLGLFIVLAIIVWFRSKANQASEQKEPSGAGVSSMYGSTHGMSDRTPTSVTNPAYVDDGNAANTPTAVGANLQIVPEKSVSPTTNVDAAVGSISTPLLISLAKRLYTMFDDDLDGGDDTTMSQDDLQMVADNVHHTLDAAAVKVLMSESGISDRMGRNAGGGADGSAAAKSLQASLLVQVQAEGGCTLQQFMQMALKAAVPM